MFHQRSPGRAGSVAIAIVALLAACSDRPTEPAPTRQNATIAVRIDRVSTSGDVQSALQVVFARTAGRSAVPLPGGAATIGTHQPVDPKGKKGISHTAIAHDKDGHKAFLRLARHEDGAPIAAMEMVVDGKVASATKLHWAKGKGDYVLQAVVTERYLPDGEIVRVTFADANGAPPSANWVAGTSHLGPQVAPTRASPESLSFLAAGNAFQHLEFSSPQGLKPLHGASCSQPKCWAELFAAISAGAAAVAAFAAVPAGAIAAFFTGGALAPADAALVVAYLAAEASFVAAEAAYVACRNGK